MSAGGDAVAMLTAILAGEQYPPPGVADDDANRALWDGIVRDVEDLPPGAVPDIPHDWSELPDDTPGTGPPPFEGITGAFDPGEARDRQGQWTGDGVAVEVKRTATGRAAAQTPSQFTHPDTGHLMGKTEIGDTFEALFAARGAHLLTAAYGGPYQRISGAGHPGGGRGARNTPLDFQLDHTHAGELKTLNVHARNKKTAIKAAEVARKDAAARAAGMAPLLAVQVVDMASGKAEVYAWPAFASKTAAAMTRLGSYEFSPGDFRAAQEATGHWAQRQARAEQQARQKVRAADSAGQDPPPEDPGPEPGDTVLELRDGVPWIMTHPGTQAAPGSGGSGGEGDGEGPYTDVTAAFDPGEARDPEGRWVAGAVGKLAVRQRINFRGHDIDRTKNKGYRVRLKTGEVQHYERPEHAARAAVEGRHFTPGGRRESLGEWSRADLQRLDELAATRGLGGAEKGDEALAVIAAVQGFDGPPGHGSTAATVKAGGIAVYRGLNDPGGRAAAWAKAYTDGTDRRQGLGVTGNGNYFTTDRSIAEEYAGTSENLDPSERGPGMVIGGALKPGARTVEFGQLQKEWSHYQYDPARKGQPGQAATEDIGRYAAMRGYDAIGLDYMGTGATDSYIVLNRTALVVEP